MKHLLSIAICVSSLGLFSCKDSVKLLGGEKHSNLKSLVDNLNELNKKDVYDDGMKCDFSLEEDTFFFNMEYTKPFPNNDQFEVAKSDTNVQKMILSMLLSNIPNDPESTKEEDKIIQNIMSQLTENELSIGVKVVSFAGSFKYVTNSKDALSRAKKFRP